MQTQNETTGTTALPPALADAASLLTGYETTSVRWQNRPYERTHALTTDAAGHASAWFIPSRIDYAVEEPCAAHAETCATTLTAFRTTENAPELDPIITALRELSAACAESLRIQRLGYEAYCGAQQAPRIRVHLMREHDVIATLANDAHATSATSDNYRESGLRVVINGDELATVHIHHLHVALSSQYESYDHRTETPNDLPARITSADVLRYRDSAGPGDDKNEDSSLMLYRRINNEQFVCLAFTDPTSMRTTQPDVWQYLCHTRVGEWLFDVTTEAAEVAPRLLGGDDWQTALNVVFASALLCRADADTHQHDAWGDFTESRNRFRAVGERTRFGQWLRASEEHEEHVAD